MLPGDLNQGRFGETCGTTCSNPDPGNPRRFRAASGKQGHQSRGIRELEATTLHAQPNKQNLPKLPYSTQKYQAKKHSNKMLIMKSQAKPNSQMGRALASNHHPPPSPFVAFWDALQPLLSLRCSLIPVSLICFWIFFIMRHFHISIFTILDGCVDIV